MGNSYTAALYVGLASLFDLAKEDLTGKRIGFYSYGSGCVAEYFSGVVEPSYREALHTPYHTDLLASRTALTYEEYEAFYTFNYAEDGSDQEIPVYRTGAFRLARLQHHKRIYEKNQASVTIKPVIKSLRHTEKNVTGAPPQALKILVPGKLILSGEHAVLYGNPALAMAMNRYVTATVTRETLPQILFDLSDIAHRSHLSFSALHHLKDRIKHKYHSFMRGDFGIRDVLQKPFELAQFALGVLAESLNLSLPHGVKIHVQSDIPIGCGLGSSAATILGVMQAVSHYLQQPLSQEQLFQLALEAENMQHGRSSGLDLRIAMQGGCLYMHQQHIEKRSIPSLPMYLVNTGKPATTTGQCVEKVMPHFKSTSLKDEFTAVTQAMDTAIQQASWQDMQQAIRENHRLLVNIGVVPEKVRRFISQVESIHGAAKVCGAGAVAGAQAGAVLVTTEDKTALTSLSARFGYNIIPISGELRGVHAA